METQVALDKLAEELKDVPEEERLARIEMVRQCIEFAEETINKKAAAKAAADKGKMEYLPTIGVSICVPFIIASVVAPAHDKLFAILSILIAWMPGYFYVRYYNRKIDASRSL